jgi:hypothetical protein
MKHHCSASLQACNENPAARMTPCGGRSSHFYRAKFIPKLSRNGRSSFHRIRQLRWLCFNEYGESNMINKLLGAAAMAAMIYSTVPASAAHLAGCSGENLAKTESAVEVMADGAGKSTAQKEIALAQAALLDGKLGACAAHLSKAIHVESAK